MITTTLKVEFTEALPSGLRCTMCKTLEMPYALRVGDSLCEGDPYSDEALDLAVQAAWYELQTATLTVLCDGAHELDPGSVEPLRQLLFAHGWMQELPVPTRPATPPPARVGTCGKCGEQRQQCRATTVCPGALLTPRTPTGEEPPF